MNNTITNNRQIAKNAVFLYIRMLLLMLVSLYTTRVLLRVLGIDNYGIFNVVGGLIVMVSFLTAGLTGASRRFILAELSIGNLSSQRLNYTYVIIAHVILCLFILLLGENIGLWFFNNYLNIPEPRQAAAVWVYHLSLFSCLVNIMISPYNSVIVAEERMSIYAYFSIIDAGLKLLIVWLLTLIPWDKLITYALLLLFVNLFDWGLYFIYCKNKFPMCRIVKVNNLSRLKEIFGYVGWTILGVGANMTSKQGVTMLINIYYNVAVNAAIGISNMIVNAATQFVNNFQVAFQPQITKNYVSGNNNDITLLVERSARYSSLLVLIIVIPIIILLSDILTVWLGTYPQYTQEFCLLALLCIYLDALSSPLVSVITSDKNIRNYQIYISLIYLFEFLLSWAVLVAGLLPYYVIVVRFFFSVVGMGLRLILLKKKVEVFSIKKWVHAILGRSFIIVLFSLPLFAVSMFCLTHSNIWLRLVSLGLISVIWMAILIWIFGITKNERGFVIEKAKQIVSRRS